MRSSGIVISMGVIMIMCVTAFAAEPEKIRPLQPGAAAPDFNLPAVDGNNYTLNDFARADILVVIFTCNHCPTAQAYEGRIMSIVTDYKGKGVAVVAISPNDPLAVRLDELGYTDLSDSFDEMKVRAEEKKFNFPYLYDGQTQQVSRAYGPLSTPHVFVFDKERKLCYAGGIDNSEDQRKADKQYLRDALDAMLAGKEVAVKQARSFGCSIKWADKREWVKKGFEDWAKEPVKLEAMDANGVRELMRNDSNSLRLVNIWATWCGPCVVEFPALVEMNRMYRGREFEMVTLSVDAPEKREGVLAFLKQRQASCRNYHYSSTEREALFAAVGRNWEGVLPCTLIIKPGGEVVYSQEGVIDPLETRRAIVGELGRYFFK